MELELEPRKQPRQRRSRELVAVLLEATTRVLAEDGYANATTNRIAEVAGVSVGSLYQYFPGKGALVFAVQQQHADEVMAMLAESAGMYAAPVPAVIRAFVRAMIASHAVDARVHRALLEQILAVGLEKIQDLQDRARSMVEAFLELRRAELDVKNPKMAAWMLVTIVESAVHAALLEDAALLGQPAFEDELVRMLNRYLGFPQVAR